MSRDRFVTQVLADYSTLEPGEADSWNPLTSKFQLGYRLNHFYALARSLALIDMPVSALRVLDLGCGNGRSARTYLDLGLEPEQVGGIDLRPGAIARAARSNPALRWDVYDGGRLPVGHNWLSTSTVFSSVASKEARQEIAALIWDSLPPGGYVFYYDGRVANPFAGGDVIAPEAVFDRFDIVWRCALGRFSGIPARDKLSGILATGLRGDSGRPSLRELIGDALAPSQQAMLFRKPRIGAP
jgi:SAM-dependent methyltransferase